MCSNACRLYIEKANEHKALPFEAASFFVAGKELNYEHRHKNTGEKNRQRSCATKKNSHRTLAKKHRALQRLSLSWCRLYLLEYRRERYADRYGQDHQAKEVMTD
ncbi:hypothetical protein L1765_08215 [Microaerobacter geothermalis]|uniref:hypothetical protein n=1 Tax=Microaerobacter geothermalis TaxID=674972 RepID=UPI001F1F0E8C|nr:hypothetical protein [Microaerobacter geothermalis]MCF6093955.1 hypothetical protein [Microaerobacter geothermalis]